MIAYLPFGDYSCDGHGQCDYELVWIDSIVKLINAQENIKNKYGENFFNTFAADYEDNSLKEVHWKALIDTNYPIERLIEYEDTNNWSGMTCIDDVLEYDPNPYVCLDFVEDTFIWLLNAFDAEIVRLDAGEDIPMICNWTCPGFETVGYGCFW